MVSGHAGQHNAASTSTSLTDHDQDPSATPTPKPTPHYSPPPGPTAPTRSTTIVLLYVPNLICYFRVVLLAAAAVLMSHRPALTAGLLLLNMILDGADGVAARRLGQTSSFGAFLDVAVDLATRGVLWSWAAPGGLGAVVMLLEALTFTCTHAAAGATWKDAGHFTAAPVWVQAVMANGFKTPLGAVAVAGLMCCPLWLWTRRALPGTIWSSPLLGPPLIVGRLVAAAVEVWVVWSYLGALLRRDAGSSGRGQAGAVGWSGSGGGVGVEGCGAVIEAAHTSSPAGAVDQHDAVVGVSAAAKVS